MPLPVADIEERNAIAPKITTNHFARIGMIM
jgi:hypothetical protein